RSFAQPDTGAALSAVNQIGSPRIRRIKSTRSAGANNTNKLVAAGASRCNIRWFRKANRRSAFGLEACYEGEDESVGYPCVGVGVAVCVASHEQRTRCSSPRGGRRAWQPHPQ